MNGGYQTISFHNVNITTGEATTIAGIYESIEGSHRKALMIGDVIIDNVEKRSCYVDCTAGDNSFTFSAYGKNFTITNEDSVTVE